MKHYLRHENGANESWPRCKPGLIALIWPLRPRDQAPFTALKPFDVTQVCHESQICSRFRQIRKTILEMTFSAHRTSIWKLNRISRTNIKKSCTKMHLMLWLCPVKGGRAPHDICSWGKIVLWGMKAPEGHVRLFSQRSSGNPARVWVCISDLRRFSYHFDKWNRIPGSWRQ